MPGDNGASFRLARRRKEIFGFFLSDVLLAPIGFISLGFALGAHDGLMAGIGIGLIAMSLWGRSLFALGDPLFIAAEERYIKMRADEFIRGFEAGREFDRGLAQARANGRRAERPGEPGIPPA